MIAATFISNSQYYSYPVELWKQGLKNFETKVFETRKVLKPEDIAIIQNECLTELFKTHEIVYWLQADLIFDAEKTQKVLDMVYTTDFNFELGISKCMLYMDYAISGFGSLVIRKKWFNEAGGKFNGDGAYCGNSGSGCLNEIFGIDVGYLGKSNFKNHLTQQKTIWPPGPSQMPVYSLNKIINSDVYKLGLDYFNLRDEFNEFKNDFNREKWRGGMISKWVGKKY